MNIGNKIKNLRRNTVNLTQEELAERTDTYRKATFHK